MQMLGHFLYSLSNLLGRLPEGRILRVKQNFPLFEDEVLEGMRQKTKEIIVPREKFHPVENSDHFF